MARAILLGVVVAGAAVLPSGCSATQQRNRDARRAMNTTLHANIVKVITFYGNNPFMSFDAAGDPNPEGLKVVYYAVAGETQQGAHGDGVIRFKMYVIKRVPGVATSGLLVKTWEYTPEQARGWRVAHKNYMGWPYQFHLNWGDVDVLGQEIRIVPEFERRDGAIVRGSTKVLRVPGRKEVVPLIDEHATN